MLFDYMRKFTVFIFLLFLFTNVISQEIEHLETEAQSGDGILSILRRYNLASHDCNIRAFHKINKLKINQGLIVGKSYLLPIYLYSYNGVSIRSSISNEDWDKAVRIQNFNDDHFKNEIKASDYRKSKILWVPHHELDCKRPDGVSIPKSSLEGEKTSGNRIYPIFGKKYQKVPLIDNSLKGKVFYVVSGHGGPDPGAMGIRNKKNLCEDEYAYDVSLRLARRLLERGALVYIITRDPNDGIRDSDILKQDRDEYCWKNQKIPAGQKSRLTQRSDAVNDLYFKHIKAGNNNQKVIVIHIDSRSKGERIDCFFYHHPESKSGRSLAKNLQSTFKKKYKRYQPNRGYSGNVSGRDLHMLRETKPTSVFVELGNIRNNADQQRFLPKENREALAKWLYEGLIK